MRLYQAYFYQLCIKAIHVHIFLSISEIGIKVQLTNYWTRCTVISDWYLNKQLEIDTQRFLR